MRHVDGGAGRRRAQTPVRTEAKPNERAQGVDGCPRPLVPASAIHAALAHGAHAACADVDLADTGVMADMTRLRHTQPMAAARRASALSAPPPPLRRVTAPPPATAPRPQGLETGLWSTLVLWWVRSRSRFSGSVGRSEYRVSASQRCFYGSGGAGHFFAFLT